MDELKMNYQKLSKVSYKKTVTPLPPFPLQGYGCKTLLFIPLNLLPPPPYCPPRLAKLSFF